MRDVAQSGRARNRQVEYLIAGTTGGIFGGLFFGLLLGAIGALPQIARLIGGSSLATGLAVHLAISALFGAIFGLLLARRPTGGANVVGFGIAYGVFWWVVGALVLMPVLLGSDPQLGRALTPPNLLSLFGHLVFGVATSVTVMVMTRYRDAFD